MELSTIISITSLIVSAASAVWIGAFKFSAVIHELKALNVRVDKLEDKIDTGFGRIDRRFEKTGIAHGFVPVRDA